MITITLTVTEYEPTNVRASLRTAQDQPTEREIKVAEQIYYGIQSGMKKNMKDAKATVIVQRDQR